MLVAASTSLVQIGFPYAQLRPLEAFQLARSEHCQSRICIRLRLAYLYRIEWNGMEWNGMEWDGMKWNGMEWHGMEWNAVEWHGLE